MSDIWVSAQALEHGDHGAWLKSPETGYIQMSPTAELKALKAENERLRKFVKKIRKKGTSPLRVCDLRAECDAALTNGESQEVTDEDMRKFMDAPESDFGRCEGWDD